MIKERNKKTIELLEGKTVKKINYFLGRTSIIIESVEFTDGCLIELSGDAGLAKIEDIHLDG